MAAWLWWTLAASVFVGLIVAATAFTIAMRKVRNIKRDTQRQVTNNEITTAARAFERESYGKLLNHLKDDKKHTLGDLEMEYALNTFFRNNFRHFNIVNAQSEYEKLSFSQLVDGVHADENYDFCLIFLSDDPYQNSSFVKNSFRNLKQGGIIFITHHQGFGKITKKIIEDCKFLQLRNEVQKIGRGLILIAK